MNHLDNLWDLQNLSYGDLKNNIIENLDIPQFTNFYPYNLESISVMLYHCLHNKLIIDILEKKTDNYFCLGSDIGLSIANHPNVNDFNHTDVSLAQTVFIVQQIIRKGIKGVVNFYTHK